MILLDHAAIAAALAAGQRRAAQQEQSVELKLLGPVLWIDGAGPVIRELDELLVKVTYRGISRGPITIVRTEPALPAPWLPIVAQMIAEGLGHEEDALRAELEVAELEREQPYVNSLDREALS